MKLESTSKAQFLTIEADREGQRIDNLLIGLLKGVPKTRIYRIIRKGEVRINKGRVKADYRVCADDLLRIPPIRVSENPQLVINTALDNVKQLEQCIIHQNNDWLAINKPTGIAVHGGSGLSFGVVEGLRALHPEWHYLELVHRIDRETSGVLLLARKRSLLRNLHEQLRNRQMSKRYLCLVHGNWPDILKESRAPLLKSSGRGGERIMVVSDEGQGSHTKFRVLARHANTSLVEATPVTGRTHQIRVHCLHEGFPIIGDPKYVSDSTLKDKEKKWGVSRLMLHAATLRFTQDTQKQLVKAPVDRAFSQLLKSLQYPEHLISDYLT